MDREENRGRRDRRPELDTPLERELLVLLRRLTPRQRRKALELLRGMEEDDHG